MSTPKNKSTGNLKLPKNMTGTNSSRRSFLLKSMAAGLGITTLGQLPLAAFAKKSNMKLGLVTYQWGKDWDLPTLIANCEKSGLLGVELRTEHAHGVETSLSSRERREVKNRFADSPVTCVGYGSNFAYHYADQAKVRQNIEGTKEYLKLCKDIGSSGIKVKPNGLPEGVPKEKPSRKLLPPLMRLGPMQRIWDNWFE